MLSVSDQDFESLIATALDELPKKYTDNMSNVAVTYADEPDPEQRAALKLHCNQTLYGLYQGIPLSQRGSGYNFVLPDKITIFKQPMLLHSYSLEQLKAHIKHTLWHEIAHHFGLEHTRIHELERAH